MLQDRKFTRGLTAATSRLQALPHQNLRKSRMQMMILQLTASGAKAACRACVHVHIAGCKLRLPPRTRNIQAQQKIIVVSACTCSFFNCTNRWKAQGPSCGARHGWCTSAISALIIGL